MLIGPGLGEVPLREVRIGRLGYDWLCLLSTKNRYRPSILLVDLQNVDATHKAVEVHIHHYGATRVVVHNPAKLIIDPLSNTSFDGFEDASQAMVLSAFVVAKSASASTVDAGGGSFVVSDTTASLRGRGRFFAFDSAKFAL